MAKENKEPLYDTRLIERNLRKGRLDPKDYEAYLKKLPDDSNRCEYMEITEETLEDVLGQTKERLTFS